jgi:hypothetical protein
MEDNLNLFLNGRRPHFFGLMEDDFIIFVTGRRPESFQMEDNHNILVNGDNLNFIQMEADLKQIMQPKTIKMKTMVVAPLRVT